ncbi:hypothetical protein [Streptosporangium jomthongense]|uniref:Uncharacterized protein n=1 Tax=Streptosporangium jomthongense TaxID=1193683 RepID=A0ABV8EYF0_9ACTN
MALFFNDKGDDYAQDSSTGLNVVTCGQCGTTHSISKPFDDHTCGCGRVLNGSGRANAPDLGKNP